MIDDFKTRLHETINKLIDGQDASSDWWEDDVAWIYDRVDDLMEKDQ